MEELWKEIPRYPFCEVSNAGRVRYKNGHYVHGLALQMRPLKLGGFGYYQVNIKGKTESVHNLVAETFIGSKPSEFHRVDHINGNKLDNIPENLRWITHGANTKRAAGSGKRRFFSMEDMTEIKKMLKERISYRKIGLKFNCTKSMIFSISRGAKDDHIIGNSSYLT